MFNNIALDVFIGLVFIFLLYSLLATIIQEIIATQLAFRSKILEKAILRMLEDGRTTSGVQFADRIKGFLHMLGFFNLLKNKKLVPWFYAHPLIRYLAEDNYYSKPAYLDARNFSKVMIDLLKGIDAPASNAIQNIHASIQNETIYKLPVNIGMDRSNPAVKAILHQDPELKTAAFVPGNEVVKMNADTALYLKSIWEESGADIETFRMKLEQWFDDTMARATGWYKRYTQVFLLAIGLFLAVSFNIDTIRITNKLSKDPKLREQMVQNANAYLERNKQLGDQLQQLRAQGKDSGQVYQDLQEKYDSITMRTDSLLDAAKELTNGEIKNVNEVMALGYTCHHVKFLHLFWFLYPDVTFLNFLGWLITALAISLGAPFWFDLLNKLMKLRGTGTRIVSTDTTVSKTGAGASTTPVTVNVNSNPGEEAVG